MGNFQTNNPQLRVSNKKDQRQNSEYLGNIDPQLHIQGERFHPHHSKRMVSRKRPQTTDPRDPKRTIQCKDIEQIPVVDHTGMVFFTAVRRIREVP